VYFALLPLPNPYIVLYIVVNYIGGKMRRFFTENLSPVEFLVLLSLKDGKKHGYGVIKDLQEHFGSSLEVKSGTVYPALRRLEGRGLVQTSFYESEQKEYYAITEEGKSRLEESLAPLEEGLDFSSRYYDFVCRRHPKMGKRFKLHFPEGPLTLDVTDMLAMVAGLPKEKRVEWLEMKKRKLEERLEFIRKLLEKEKGDTQPL